MDTITRYSTQERLSVLEALRTGTAILIKAALLGGFVWTLLYILLGMFRMLEFSTVVYDSTKILTPFLTFIDSNKDFIILAYFIIGIYLWPAYEAIKSTIKHKRKRKYQFAQTSKSQVWFFAAILSALFIVCSTLIIFFNVKNESESLLNCLHRAILGLMTIPENTKNYSDLIFDFKQLYESQAEAESTFLWTTLINFVLNATLVYLWANTRLLGIHLPVTRPKKPSEEQPISPSV